MKTFVPVAAAAAVFCAAAVVDGQRGADAGPSQTVVDLAVGSPDHTTLVTAVTTAGLADTLAGDGPFTVFAPTDAAFAKLPDGTLDTLLAEPGYETLTKILTCHVLAAEVMSPDVVALITQGGGVAEVETLGGCGFTVSAEGGAVVITDGQGNEATVTAVDLDASNGVVHVIDTVLLPAS